MADDTDSTADETTTSTKARAPWLGTTLALEVVTAPWLLAGALLSLTGAIPLWLQAVLAFEAVAGTVWWVGAGTAKLAKDIAGIGGS